MTAGLRPDPARYAPLPIVLRADGTADVAGVPVEVPDAAGTTGLRMAAVHTAMEIVSVLSHPVRATAVEPDGTGWAALLYPDGRVEEADGPLPFVPPTGAWGPGAEDGPELLPTEGMFADPPDAAGPGHADGPVLEPGVQSPPPPARLREILLRVREAAEAGRLTKAAELAAGLEQSVASQQGESHPHTLQVRGVQGHLAVLSEDWAQAAEIHVDVAAQWLRTAGVHHSLTWQNAANAHVCWRRVRGGPDAVRIGDKLVELWSRTAAEGLGERYLRLAERRLARLRATTAP
ncbi:hypothetical protein GCM10023347_44540 [Streptomyces chumphonensis]|uniref:Uncharacterized protein n=1 Tax=Streptomyces chumphonensis TaxID=1214925 RepID=A0A927F0D9_9ACTN|nr:hypothetical protein [Streptomyces chumphonensis]MBD3932061.1 hypothetical protein [Streptomyces chumphonensis]